MLEVKIVGYDFDGVVKWWMKVAERGHVGVMYIWRCVLWKTIL